MSFFVKFATGNDYVQKNMPRSQSSIEKNMDFSKIVGTNTALLADKYSSVNVINYAQDLAVAQQKDDFFTNQ